MPTTLPAHYSVTAPSGRVINFSTFGPATGRPLLLINGSPSNWATIDIVRPYTELIQRLNILVIQPERVGNGVTPFPSCSAPYDECVTPSNDADDWSFLMHRLGYPRYSVAGLSAGGIYADFVAALHWKEITSLHLSSAVDSSGSWEYCPVTDAPDTWRDAYQPFLDDPSQIWSQFPARDLQTMSSIPGALDWFSMMLHASPDAIGASYDTYVQCHYPVGDLSHVRTPVFIYHGGIDQTVPLSDAETHAEQYSYVRRFQIYPNDAHLSWLRHFGQLLVDVSQPSGHQHLVCDRSHSSPVTLIVDDVAARRMLDNGRATEDICAWVGTPGQ